jgi:hypothetical protein
MGRAARGLETPSNRAGRSMQPAAPPSWAALSCGREAIMLMSDIENPIHHNAGCMGSFEGGAHGDSPRRGSNPPRHWRSHPNAHPDRLWVGILDLLGVWWLIRRRGRVPQVIEVRRSAG